MSNIGEKYDDIDWDLKIYYVNAALNHLGFYVDLRPMTPLNKYVSLCCCLSLVLEGMTNKAYFLAQSL